MPDMTKKHFIALADAIKKHNKALRLGAETGYSTKMFYQVHLDVLAEFCASFNPAFNRERWFDYIAGKCGPSGGYKEKRRRVPKSKKLHPDELVETPTVLSTKSIAELLETIYSEPKALEKIKPEPKPEEPRKPVSHSKSFEEEIESCYREKP